MPAVDDDVLRVLGVARDADAATVKQAFRTLAARYHPDRSDGGDPTKFTEVTRAYQAWCATHEPAAAPDTARAPHATMPPMEEIFDSFKDLFGEFFGTASKDKRGADRRQQLRVSYVEARDGAARDVAVTRRTLCPTCAGTGARDGATEPCTSCKATGSRHATQGMFQIQTPCSVCRGSGAIPIAACEACDAGGIEQVETIRVTVPAGVQTGQQLRCAGKGDVIRGGETGHLYLTILVDTLGVIQRTGDNVTLETQVDTRHLLFGGVLDVNTLDGPVSVRVPRGVEDGTVITLPGRGHPRSSAAPASSNPYRGAVPRGDQLVVFRVPPEAKRTRTQVIWGITLAGALLVLALAGLL
jgi:molecular chaperone DnaJ